MPNDNITTGIYIDRDLHEIIQSYLRAADCRSRNEFINKAIRHYIAFLQKENDNEFLTPALESILSGMIGGTENPVPAHGQPDCAGKRNPAQCHGAVYRHEAAVSGAGQGRESEKGEGAVSDGLRRGGFSSTIVDKN
jgi:hypothetical protein